MTTKTFFRPTWFKSAATAASFILFVVLAFSVGRDEARINSSVTSQIGADIQLLPAVGGLSPHTLNPVLWLPAPVVTMDRNYTEMFPVDTNALVTISILYWMLLSYLLSCIVASITKKEHRNR